MREVFEPTVRMIPAEYRSQIEPAQFFHEVLTHRWFLAEQAGHDVPMVEAVESYIASVLPKYKLDASMMDAINADADSDVIDDERTLGTNTYGNGVFDADGRPGPPRTADDDDDYNPDDDPDAAVWSH